MKILKAIGWGLLALISFPLIVPPMICIGKIIALWKPEAYKEWRTGSPVFTGAFNVRVVPEKEKSGC